MTHLPVLGRLSSVPPRTGWHDEARDLTPRLLKNADVLSDVLSMDVDLETDEPHVGNFSLDPIGKTRTRNFRAPKGVLVGGQMVNLLRRGERPPGGRTPRKVRSCAYDHRHAGRLQRLGLSRALLLPTDRRREDNHD